MVQIKTDSTETTKIIEIESISEAIFNITTDLFRDTTMKDKTPTTMVIRTDQTKTKGQ